MTHIWHILSIFLAPWLADSLSNCLVVQLLTVHRVSEKTVKFFVLHLSQMFTKFDTLWYEDG